MRKALSILIVALAILGTGLAEPARGQAGGGDEPRRVHEQVVGEEFSPAGRQDRPRTRLDHSRGVAAELVLAPMAVVGESRARDSGKSAPLRIGVNRPVPDSWRGRIAAAMLDWQSVRGDRGRAAAFAVTSPGAVAVRLGFSGARLPAGAELVFFDPRDPRHAIGPFRRADLPRGADGDGAATFWSPVIHGETVAAEVYLPGTPTVDGVVLVPTQISHLYYSPGAHQLRDLIDLGSSGRCEVDVACDRNVGRIADSVAKIVATDAMGSFLCTGQLVNDTDSSSAKPYFTTANHCIPDQATADSIDFFWFFERGRCGSGDPVSVKQTSGGARLLHTSDADAGTDLSLLLLKRPPPGGTFLSGWKASRATDRSSVMGVHHPSGDVKKVSKGTVLGVEPWDRQRFDSHYLVRWSSGVTEGGSSGSGLWEGDSLIGVLTGGGSFCSSPAEPDLYGRLDLIFPELARWLDPAGDGDGDGDDDGGGDGGGDGGDGDGDVGLVAPGLLSPKGRIDDYWPTFTWTEVPGAEEYEFLLADRWGLLYGDFFRARGICANGTCRLSTRDTEGLWRGKYRWRVRAWRRYERGPWSSVQTFKVR